MKRYKGWKWKKKENKRLDLDVNVQLERLDEDGVTTLKFVHVDVTDISKVTSTNIPKIETKLIGNRRRFIQVITGTNNTICRSKRQF